MRPFLPAPHHPPRNCCAHPMCNGPRLSTVRPDFGSLHLAWRGAFISFLASAKTRDPLPSPGLRRSQADVPSGRSRTRFPMENREEAPRGPRRSFQVVRRRQKKRRISRQVVYRHSSRRKRTARKTNRQIAPSPAPRAQGIRTPTFGAGLRSRCRRKQSLGRRTMRDASAGSSVMDDVANRFRCPIEMRLRQSSSACANAAAPAPAISVYRAR